VHVLLTGEQGEYYRYYSGFADLVPALELGYVYDDLRPPVAEGRYHRYSAAPVDLARLVHCVQNHDQVGNRARETG
jgi:maltooligosyltrehalose trehalohydrolase